jgi:hypothetical protein
MALISVPLPEGRGSLISGSERMRDKKGKEKFRKFASVAVSEP